MTRQSLQWLAFISSASAEYFMYKGKATLVVYDDLSATPAQITAKWWRLLARGISGDVPAFHPGCWSAKAQLSWARYD